jgi:hypothetical protein
MNYVLGVGLEDGDFVATAVGALCLSVCVCVFPLVRYLTHESFSCHFTFVL